MSGNVVHLSRVEISDFAKALLEIENESMALNEQSTRLHHEQIEVMSRAMETVRLLGARQEELIQKRMALDDTKMALLTGKAGL